MIEGKHYAVNPETGCWDWAMSTSGGYGQIWIGGRKHRAHRVSYEMHHGEIPRGQNVCHRCDNPSCVNPGHLFAGSQSDNMGDCSAKGRNPGNRVNHVRRVASEEIVREARSMRGRGCTQREIGERFGVTQSAVSRWLA